MKKAISYIVMPLIILGLLIAMSIFLYLATPPNSQKIHKIIHIEPGASFAEVAGILKGEGIIKDVARFSLLARYHQGTRRIKAGEYYLHTSMLPLEVLDVLVKGEVIEHPTTIPEGYNIYQIADLLDDAGLVDREKFLEMCFDRTLISDFGIEGDSLEGYLFPDTYLMPGNISERVIIELMVARFREVYVGKYTERSRELGLTEKEVLTLASIIEKETGQSWERPLISAVFQNRLKKRIRLQSDPTSVYGIPDFTGRIRKKHLKRKSPYNTYRYGGLPPGPIANPGEASIKAVLYPAKVNYLYFVSKNNGTHHFSDNLREHNIAVRKYQKRKRLFNQETSSRQ